MRRLLSEVVVFPAGKDKRVVQQRFKSELVLLRAEQIDAELGVAVENALEDQVRPLVDDPDPDLRVPGVERLDHGRKEIIGGGRNARDVHLAQAPLSSKLGARTEAKQHPLFRSPTKSWSYSHHEDYSSQSADDLFHLALNR